MTAEGITIPDTATGVLVAVDGTVEGALAVRDTVRPSAAAAVTRLHRLGLRTVLLTGDRPTVAHAVAAEVGITEVLAEVRPEDKATTVDHPVLAMRGGHNAVLNSAGLRLAGIGPDTPDLPGGFIARDAAGRPTGWVQDTALELAPKCCPPNYSRRAWPRLRPQHHRPGTGAGLDAAPGLRRGHRGPEPPDADSR